MASSGVARLTVLVWLLRSMSVVCSEPPHVYVCMFAARQAA